MASKPKSPIDGDMIRELAALLHDNDLSEIEIEQDDFRIRVAGGVSAVNIAAPVQAVAAPAPAAGAPATGDPARHPGAVSSPMVGTVYCAPEPGARPFVDVGDTVREGQTLLIIEAMKHMNEVPSPRAGKVVEILVEDGQPIEFGETLLILE
ncbi:MAG: acetyl-CoA carboxylase biotin carboxyl carrier protein [Alphaproteobacteria bacterium]